MCTSTIIKKESLVKNPIVILGGGPSGVVCAIGLKKLGFNVILISKKRPFDALEGFSHRTIEGFKKAGCAYALETIKYKAKREATWNNITYDKNFEFIVERKLFDEALLQDAKSYGVKVIKGAGQIINERLSTIKVMKRNTIIKASFIVDARGRMSPRNSQKKSKETVSYLIKYSKKNDTCKTSLHTSEEGWIWRATYGTNSNYLQLTTTSGNSRAKIEEIMNHEERININNTHKIITREATSYISKEIISKNILKIGDAACAVDPLSGSGVFQALSTALISPYVINTLLYGSNADKLAATSFFKDRVNDIFFRYARMGREFYSLEKQFINKFWVQRSIWPDLKKYNKSSSLNEVSIKRKAILIEPFIKAHDVVITNNMPMGIWRLGRINLVNIVKKLLEVTKVERELVLKEETNNLNIFDKEKQLLYNWCKEHTLI